MENRKYGKWKDTSDIPIPLTTCKRLKKAKKFYENLLHEGDDSREPSDDFINSINLNEDFINSLNDSDLENGSENSIQYEEYNLHENPNVTNVDNAEVNSDTESQDSQMSTNDNQENDEQVENLLPNICGARNPVMLYKDSDKTLNEAVLDIMDLYLENNLTKSALIKLLKVIHKMLPHGNHLPTSVYQLFQYVKKAGPDCPTVLHYACKNLKCRLYIGTDINKKCSGCSGQEGKSTFYEIDIENQIKYMFEHRNLAQKLKAFENNNFISDITDGSEYIRVRTENNMGIYDLTLILNTDGLKLAKSSKSECWPFMFMIAEVQEHLRESFLVVAGIWIDDRDKPLMNTFLQPFCLQLIKYFDNGITWVNPTTKEKCKSKVVAPLFSLDAPARAMVQNVHQYNGCYGCNICEVKTKRCRRQEGIRSKRVYYFTETLPILRTAERMEKQGKKAVKYGLTDVKGVKGLSIVSCLPGLDLGTCITSELLHTGLLGVVKRWCYILIEAKGPWNLSKHLTEIDSRLLNIKPPQCFSRMPNNLSNFSAFKGHELLNWALYYSIPLLHNTLKDRYFQHWLLLIRALFLLLQKKISKKNLEEADLLLKLFVRDVDPLYGDRNLTYNTHQLLHFSLCVARWGPLWATANFAFESYNGKISRSLHGARNHGPELINKLKISMSVQMLRGRVIDESETENFVLDNTDVMGKSSYIELRDVEREVLAQAGLNELTTTFFKRAKICGEVYTSEVYKVTKTNSYTIAVNYENTLKVGVIRFFFEINNDLCFMMRCFEIDRDNFIYHNATGIQVSHIIPIRESDVFIIVNQRTAQSICQTVRVENFVCLRPNLLRKVL